MPSYSNKILKLLTPPNVKFSFPHCKIAMTDDNNTFNIFISIWELKNKSDIVLWMPKSINFLTAWWDPLHKAFLNTHIASLLISK